MRIVWLLACDFVVKEVLECITARAPAMDVPYDEIDYDDLEDIRYISKGNFGQIYRANYHGTDVAVKQLLDIGNTRMHKYIEREMSLLMYGVMHHVCCSVCCSCSSMCCVHSKLLPAPLVERSVLMAFAYVIAS